MKYKGRNLHIITIASFAVFIVLGLACATYAVEEQQTRQYQQQTASQSQASAIQYWTGDGGRNMSLAILPPQAAGLEENQNYLPALVQGEFVSNFSSYSAISVLDRQRLDDQYAEIFSGYYDDDAAEGMDLGHLTPTTHIMGGNITRTETGYALQIQITKSADKMTAASYSGTFSFAELDNLTGIRQASLDLLQKIGVTLTAQAQGELSGAAAEYHINANTALARGITAQRQGTEVAALSYYFQAVAFDPSLAEAINRSSILSANISSGNIGDDVRNDIQWRRDWVARLTDAEESFIQMLNVSSPPYRLFYSTGIQRGNINYNTESIDLSIQINMRANGLWIRSIQRAYQTVYDGLNATNRKNNWGLGNWPRQGLTRNDPFSSQYDISIVFELLNEQNIVIGRQSVSLTLSFNISQSGERLTSNYNEDSLRTINFNAVKANDITDNLMIRVASVNGTTPENAQFQITALSSSTWDLYRKGASSLSVIKIENGVVKGFNGYNSATELVLLGEIWGDSTGITSIGEDSFSGFHDGYTTIYRNQLTSVIIDNGIKSIGAWAFSHGQVTNVTIGNGVTSVGHCAFLSCPISTVKIGANVNVGWHAFERGLRWNPYERNERKAGTYTKTTRGWTYTP